MVPDKAGLGATIPAADLTAMRVAVTGASGLLGRELLNFCLTRGHQAIAAVHMRPVIASGVIEQVAVDLEQSESAVRFVAQARPDWIIHSAAMTEVDRCEIDPHSARLANLEATRHLLDAVRGTKTRILFVSTDYVFDGKSGPYAEGDRENPINVYGQTKRDAELLVAADPANLIVRSASFIGVGGPERPTFIERMLETMRHNPPFKAAVDQISNTTPVPALASAMIEMIERNLSGLWHVAHPEILSRYDLGLRLAAAAQLSSSVCEPVPYATLARPAARPLRGGLRVDRMQGALTTQFGNLDSTLVDLIARTRS